MKKQEYKKDDTTFLDKISEKERRKLKAAREPKNHVWFGLGSMGMIGWSVVIPALLGVMSGTWLDNRYPQVFSWTLSLLVAGLITGSVIAWYWVDKEDKEINQNKDQDNE